MANGIPVTNITTPSSVVTNGGVIGKNIITYLQMLTPQYYNVITKRYGNEDFTWWLSTYGGMEEVKNDTFFWFERDGKLMIGVETSGAVTNITAGGNVTVTISNNDVWSDNGTNESPLRLNETVRIASNNIEGVITQVISYNQCVITPKRSTDFFASSVSGTGTLNSGEVLIFGGYVDAGEASNSISALAPRVARIENYITTMRDSWSATDFAELTETYFNSGADGTPTIGQSGTSYYTLMALLETEQRFKNDVEMKLVRGRNVTNSTFTATGTLGSKGLIQQVEERGELVGANNIDIQKLHEITRILDVQGGAKECLWLQDIYQRQSFSDGIFQEFPAGAYVWGKNENSQEAAVAYGVQSMYIDGFLLKVKKYPIFNTEYTTGKSPVSDAYRNYGIIMPQGTVADFKDSGKRLKNVTVMYKQPQRGGTVLNGIRVWRWGGGSENPTNGQLQDNVDMVTYRGIRVAAANQFVIVSQ
jgi:hypothetical protein